MPMEDETINLLQLRAFYLVAKGGTVSGAAGLLFRTQSAVTRAVREFEKDLKVILFERHPTGMVLTSEGKHILPRVEYIIEELQLIPVLLTRFKSLSPAASRTELSWLFNTRRLQLFVSLHQQHYVQQVAKQFSLSQPAVSSALRQLEEGAGLTLFERTAFGLKPTAAGNALALVIQRVINSLHHLRADIAGHLGAVTGTVRIGALPLSRSILLPQAIITASQHYPDLYVATSESDFSTLHTALCGGHLDFIIGAIRDEETYNDLNSTVLFTQELIMLVRRDHPLLTSDFSRQQLAHQQWILPRPGTPSRRLMNEAFQALGIPPPQPRLESGDSMLVRGVLTASDMVAVVSSHQLAVEMERGDLQPLPLTLPHTRRKIAILTRRGALPSPSSLAFMAVLHETARFYQHS